MGKYLNTLFAQIFANLKSQDFKDLYLQTFPKSRHLRDLIGRYFFKALKFFKYSHKNEIIQYYNSFLYTLQTKELEVGLSPSKKSYFYFLH